MGHTNRWHGLSRASGPFLAGAAFLAGACERQPAQPPAPQASGAAPAQWREFDGSWNPAGDRRTLTLGADRQASLIDLRGTMLLSGDGRPGVGFRAHLIAMVDSQSGLVGRAVWTDDRGDQVFSELTGQGTKENNSISGTFLGGTGPYRGATGTYQFSWQFMIETEDGSIQGRATGLKGRYRLEPSEPAQPSSAASTTPPAGANP